MLTNRNNRVLILAGVIGLANCKPGDESVTCKPVEKITPQSDCYNPSRGLTLVASGQTSFPDKSQFIWSVFPQRDTTLSNNVAASLENVLIGSETITIPDSLLKNAPKFVVKVKTVGCGNTELHSMFYSFVKRQSAGTACLVWQSQVQ